MRHETIHYELFDRQPENFDFVTHYKCRLNHIIVGGHNFIRNPYLFISKNLVSFSLPNYSVSDGQFLELSSALLVCHNLKKVDLSDNDITGGSCDDISLFIIDHPLLQSFNLSNNHLSQDVCLEIERCFESSGCITHIDLSKDCHYGKFSAFYRSPKCSPFGLGIISRNKGIHSSVRRLCILLLRSYKSLCLSKDVAVLISKFVFASRTDLSIWNT